MSKKSSGQNPDPTSRRQQLRLEQEKAEKEKKVRRIVTASGVGVVIVAVVGLIVWAAMSLGSANPTASGTASGATASAEYSLQFGNAEGAVTLDIYQDFMCPWCGQFERANRDDINALVAGGKVNLRIHPMSFLDSGSNGTKYSTRAANAMVTVYKAEPDKALAFNEALYDNQPAENSDGLSDAKIAELAKSAGVSQATIATFTQLTNTEFVTNTTNAAFSSGISSTPTILINGTQFSGSIVTAGELKTAVDKAIAAA
jgi:protein-disulfide isomerase